MNYIRYKEAGSNSRMTTSLDCAGYGYSFNFMQILNILCMNKKDNDDMNIVFFILPFQKQNRNHVDSISIAKQKNLNIFISSTIKYGNINNVWIMKIKNMIKQL